MTHSVTQKCSMMSPGNSFILGSKNRRSRSRVTKTCRRGCLHSCECWLLLCLSFTKAMPTYSQKRVRSAVRLVGRCHSSPVSLSPLAGAVMLLRVEFKNPGEYSVNCILHRMTSTYRRWIVPRGHVIDSKSTTRPNMSSLTLLFVSIPLSYRLPAVNLSEDGMPSSSGVGRRGIFVSFSSLQTLEN